jgi:Arc/MetJ family transcription regulator
VIDWVSSRIDVDVDEALLSEVVQAVRAASG